MGIKSFNALAAKIYDNRTGVVLAASIGLTGCANIQISDAPEDAYTNAIYSTYDNVIVIHDGRGGLVEPIISQYNQWAAQGMYIVVDGQVSSADAFGAFSESLAGRSCYTENAVFSPHSASFDLQYPDPAGTEWLATQLVDPLEREFRSSPYFNEIADVDYVTADRLREIYPQGACTPQMAAYARREPNF